jgi:hypothetical protein
MKCVCRHYETQEGPDVKLQKSGMARSFDEKKEVGVKERKKRMNKRNGNK